MLRSASLLLLLLAAAAATTNDNIRPDGNTQASSSSPSTMSTRFGSSGDPAPSDTSESEALARAGGKPNIVMILTDDQDHQLNSLDYMYGVKANLADHGTTFNRHYCTVALCCPSRVNLLTGQAAHNTNVTELNLPYGGYEKFMRENLDNKWLPKLLQDGGYDTYYVGKLMNGHSIQNYAGVPQAPRYPKGLTGHDFLLDPGTYQYFNATLQHQQEKPKQLTGSYTTDLIRDRSLNWLDEAAKKDKPFFLGIAPVSPHAALVYQPHPHGEPPIPATKYEGMFTNDPNVKVPRTKNFNPGQPSGASWIRDLKQISKDDEKHLDHYYKRRLEALQSVDELVNKTIARLEQLGKLDNTYIIYTSDNGFHIGNHRLPPGKREPYEEDINVPMIIRGPQVPKGKKQDFVTSHSDILPTILKWAGIDAPGDIDGAAIPTDGSQPAATAQNWEHCQVEHWGKGKSEGKVGGGVHTKTKNTYKALRVVGDNYSLFYSVWCDGSHELYDMSTDSQQMNNLHGDGDAPKILDVGLQAMQPRLDALLLVLKDCKGRSCTHPWSALHPEGSVNNLKDALLTKYDDFYEKQQKRVKFERCEKGYIKQNETPNRFIPFGSNSTVSARGLSGFGDGLDLADPLDEWADMAEVEMHLRDLSGADSAFLTDRDEHAWDADWQESRWKEWGMFMD